MPVYALGDFVPSLPAPGTYWIAPDAHVIGNVRIAEGTSIWFGAVLRGDNDLIDIGPGCNIQDNAVLHVDPGFPLRLEAGCSVAHNAIVHGCHVGEGSLIGMGATVMNGVTLGRDCLVGAGAVVAQGKSFPERSLILGAPGRRIRELTEDDVKRIRQTAAGYESNRVRFAEGLRRID